MEPNSAASCPDDLILTRLIEGTLSADSGSVIQFHIAACEECAIRVSEVARYVDQPGAHPGLDADRIFQGSLQKAGWPAVPSSFRKRLTPGKWRTVAAAGILLLLGGVYFVRSSFFDPGLAREEEAPIPLGTLVEGSSGMFQTQPGREEVLALPEGSRLRLGERTRLEFLAPAKGDRAHIRINEGTLEAFVPKGRGSFRVSAEGGEILVLGTHFSANAFTLSGEGVIEGFQGGPVLCVEVREGKVELRNARGEAVLEANRRGLSLARSSPIVQELGGVSQDAASRFLQTLERTERGWKVRSGQEPFSALMAATFWGASWEPRPRREEIDPILLKVREK